MRDEIKLHLLDQKVGAVNNITYNSIYGYSYLKVNRDQSLGATEIKLEVSEKSPQG